MSRVTARTFALIGMAVSVTGCGTRGFVSNALNGQAIIDDQVWLPSLDKFGEESERKYVPPACIAPVPATALASASSSDAPAPAPGASATAGSPTSTTATPEKPPVSSAAAPAVASTDPYDSWTPEKIQACTKAMQLLIDVRFARYEDSINTANSTWNTTSDLAVVGMGAAGGLIGGTTAQILSAVSGAVTGAQGKVNSDVLYSHSIRIIISQMETERASQRQVLDAKLAQTIGTNASAVTGADYKGYRSMYEAAVDLYQYARAGSWTYALQSLENAAGSAAQTCTSEARARQIKSADPNAGTDKPDKKCPGISS